MFHSGRHRATSLERAPQTELRIDAMHPFFTAQPRLFGKKFHGSQGLRCVPGSREKTIPFCGVQDQSSVSPSHASRSRHSTALETQRQKKNESSGLFSWHSIPSRSNLDINQGTVEPLCMRRDFLSAQVLASRILHTVPPRATPKVHRVSSRGSKGFASSRTRGEDCPSFVAMLSPEDSTIASAETSAKRADLPGTNFRLECHGPRHRSAARTLLGR